MPIYVTINFSVILFIVLYLKTKELQHEIIFNYTLKVQISQHKLIYKNSRAKFHKTYVRERLTLTHVN